MHRLPLELRILGPPGAFDAEGVEVAVPIGKPLAVLVYLAAHPEGVPRDHIAELLWQGAPKSRARASLRQALWILRQQVGEGLVDEGERLRLAPGVAVTDLDLVRRALEEDDLDAALSLWRGHPFELLQLPELPEWEEWAEGVRVRAEHLLGAALEARARELRKAGDPEGALEALEAAAHIRPYRADPRLQAVAYLLDLRRVGEARAALAAHRLTFAEDEAVAGALDALEGRADAMGDDRFEEEGQKGRPPLVGRSGEYAALLALWREVSRRGAAVAVIRGETGIGKTRLADEVARAAHDEDARVVRVRGEGGERELEWGTVRDLVKRLLALSGAAGVSPASDRILRGLAPSLGSAGSPEDAGPVQVSSAQLGDAVGDLVGAVSEDAPLVLLLDGLCAMDVQSRTVLVSVARRLDREPVLVLATCPAGAGDAGLEGSLTLLRRHPRFREIRLDPWGPDEVRAFLDARAVLSDPTRADDVAALLHRTSGGNPLHLVECLRLLEERGALSARDRSRGGPPWHLDLQRVPLELPLPERVRALIEEEIRSLPEEAARVAVHLARAAGRESPAGLGPRAGMSHAAVKRGVSALLDRGLVHRTDDHALAFAHAHAALLVTDVLPDFGPVGEDLRAHRRRRAALAAAAGAALVLVAVIGARTTLGPPPPPAFGGGLLVLHYPDTMLAVEVGSEEPEAWAWGAVAAQPPAPPGSLYGPGRTHTGDVVWFERRVTAEAAPWIVLRSPGGTERELVRGQGDAFFSELGADGRTALVTIENVAAPTYRHDLFRLDLETGVLSLVDEGEQQLRSSTASPDGRRLAYVAVGAEDTLVVATPDGRRLTAIPAGSAIRLGWCGGGHRLVALRREGDLFHLQEVGWQDGAFRPLHDAEGREPPPSPQSQFVCSPDGTSMLYPAAADGRTVLVLHELDAGRTRVLDSPHRLPPLRLEWASPALRPSPIDLRTELDTLRLAWGARHDLRSELLLSDGTREPVEARWMSASPSVASVTTSGRVHANGLGTAVLEAVWDGWLVDTTVVIVEGPAGLGTLLHDDFLALPPDRWLPFGEPYPYVDERDDEPVLVLPGDGRHWDGMVSAEAFPLPLGATLEAEFRMNPDRPVHQRLRFCLMEADLPEETPPGFHHEEMIRRQMVCGVYPAWELARWDPSRVALRAQWLFSLDLDAAARLPSDEWVHLAVQLRADGRASLFVGRELVGAGPLHLRNDHDVRWRVAVMGHSVGTELLLRNLQLWPGERYAAEEG